MNVADRIKYGLIIALFVLVGVFAYYVQSSSGLRISRVSVQLQMPAVQANRIELIGSFNNWNKQCCLKQDPWTGLWTITLNLLPGVYEYAFLVDGKLWVSDQHNEGLGDGLGGRNRVLYVNNPTSKQGGGDV